MITLENTELQFTIRPDLGGRIDQLVDRQTQHHWLWHPPGYEPGQTRSLSIGAAFDQHWSGGWDEMFPNDGAGQVQGRDLVDHGEVWSQAWDVVETSPLSVKLSYVCQTVPIRVEKTIQLDATQPIATLTYQLENLSSDTIPFLLKQHAAIAIEAGDEILLPDCLVEPAFLDFSKIIGRPGKTRFPQAIAADGSEVDLRMTPPESSQLQEFYYTSELAIGQCGIRHRRSQSALIIRFDKADFPYVWVFQSYGGWRDYYVLVMEPCTTIPFDLNEAYQKGTTALLKPQETQRRSLTVAIERSK
jgi:galactose mutarotase-like enzyme